MPKRTKVNVNNIGDKIYYLRKQYGLSQEELGFELGVSRQTVSKWELGTTVPDFKNLVILCEFFKVDIDYFTNSNDEKSDSIALINATHSKKNKKILIILKVISCCLIFLTAIVSVLIIIIIKIMCSKNDEIVEKVVITFVNISNVEMLIFFIVLFIILVGLIIFVFILLHKFKNK